MNMGLTDIKGDSQNLKSLRDWLVKEHLDNDELFSYFKFGGNTYIFRVNGDCYSNGPVIIWKNKALEDINDDNIDYVQNPTSPSIGKTLWFAIEWVLSQR